jgi:hypothetical protein
MRSGTRVPGGSSVLVLCAAAVVGSALVGTPGTDAGPAPPHPVSHTEMPGTQATAVSSPVSAPVTPRVREVQMAGVDQAAAAQDLAGQDVAAQDVAALSAPEPVRGYGVVGVTWEGTPPEGLDVEVRTRTDEGWSSWWPLYGSDSQAADGAGVRQGTDPLAVGEVDAVQARASSPTGEAPTDLRLSVVNPGEGPLDDAVTAPTVGAAASADQMRQGGAVSATNTADTQVSLYRGPRAPRPRIRSRRAWGADPRLRSGSPKYGRVKAGFVHHTVNANSYSRSDVPKIIRGIYAYHTQSLGWSDIGYNLLVDRFGRKWVGRYGGWRRAVIGAHTYGYNHLSTGVAAIGRFQVHGPPRRMVAGLGRLIGWKLGLHGVRAGDRSRWLDGKRFRAVNGHRDAGETACPGWRLYKKLRVVRRTAIRWQHR